MKKAILIFLTLQLSIFTLFAQSDDDLFGGSDDDFFSDDGIEIVESVTAKSDLSKGSIFENGSVKIGGRFDTSLETRTVVYADDGEDFSDHLKDTDFNPTVSAMLSVDARPTDVLRMYVKFGFGYPFVDQAMAYYSGNSTDLDNPMKKVPVLEADGSLALVTPITLSISNYFQVKEAFTDFSVADRAFFRFGLHTVTWGTGIFFSPVSDIINASSINPEDTDAQVDGVLNLRTQVTFPGSQNCLWAYVVPTSTGKAIDTALAAKYDLVLGGWELGIGGYYRYQNAPKAVLTASGSLKKATIFGEFVYRYGADSEWIANTDWDDKKSIIQATAGVSYYFKDPMIMLMGQYYYDGNDKDPKHEYFTYGHNIAAMVNFGKIFGNTDLTANLFGMVNFGKEDLPPYMQYALDQLGMGSFVNTATFSGSINYTPFANCSFGLGPYVTVNAWDKAPEVSVKLTAKLGGGKF